MALASTVLPVPGTSSMSRWPRHIRATRARRTSWCLPDDDALDVGEDLVADLLDAAHRTPVVVAACRAAVLADAGDLTPGTGRCGDVAQDQGSRTPATSVPLASSVRPERTGRVLEARQMGVRRPRIVRPSGVRASSASGRASAAEQRQAADPERPSGSRSPPMTPRNGSPPMNAATAMTPNSAASTRAIAASPMRSMSGRRGRRRARRRLGGPSGAASRVGAGVGSDSRAERGASDGSGVPVQLEVARHQVAREGRRALASAAAALDEHGDRDLRVLDRREADEPRVRLAAARPAPPCRTCRPSARPGPWRRP